MMDATREPNMRVYQEFLPSAPPSEKAVDPLSRLAKKLSIDLCEVDMPSAPFAERLPFVNPSSQIELTISARSLLNLDQITQSDPLCVVFLQDSTTSWEWIEVGRTETIFNNLNPEWKTKFIVDYRFEERQMLALMIYDKDCTKYSLDNHDFLGKLECSLGEVVSAPHSRLTRPLRLPSIHSTLGVQSTAAINCEEIGECKKTLRFQMIFTDLYKSFYTQSTSQKIFVDISKQTPAGSWVLLHRTDKIPVTATFPTVSLRMSSVCSKGNLEAPLRFQLFLSKHSFKGESSKLIGQVVTNLIELTEKCSGKGVANFHLSRAQTSALEQNLASGMFLDILNLRTEIQKTFMDYIQEGLELNYAVAIDFTASNGEPTKHSSLHYKHGKSDNPYVATLKILDDILKDYSSTHQWYAYGFGAKGYPVSNRVNHKFALNFKETNPICQGFEEVLSSYYRALQRVKLFGPTCFAPIIREVTQLAKSSLENSPVEKYFVLFLLTDGVVCDPDTTKDALVEASNAPMSIIIIGIGDEDFHEMEKLDSDEKLLKNRSKKKAARDIVQFVELKKFINFKSVVPISAGSKVALARSVLAELPQQVVSWKNLKHGVV